VDREAEYRVNENTADPFTTRDAVPSLLSELVEIGRCHEHLLKEGAIAWAGEQARLLIQMLRPRVTAWIAAACCNPQTSEEIETLASDFISRMEESLREAVKALYRHAAKHAKPKPGAKVSAASATAKRVEAPDGKGRAQEDERRNWSQSQWVDWAKLQPAGKRVSREHTMKIFNREERTFRDWAAYGFVPDTTGSYPIELICKWLDPQYRKRVRAEYRLRPEE
jgi:hypothetical protein